MKLAFLRKIALYFISGWYFYLFVVYPFVHVHWHKDHVETCFASQSVVSTEPNAIETEQMECHHKHFKGDVHNYESLPSSKTLFSQSVVPLSVLIPPGDCIDFELLSNAPKRGPSSFLSHTIVSHAPPFFC